MSPEEKRDLQYRAVRALNAPVPRSVLIGSARQAAGYKSCAAVVASCLRSGRQSDRLLVSVLRLEGMQGLA